MKQLLRLFHQWKRDSYWCSDICNQLDDTLHPYHWCEQETDLCRSIHAGTSLYQFRDNFYVPFFGSKMESIQPILI